MPADLTRNEVEEIALLARLHLEPAEIEQMRVELGAMLAHFGAIAAVDTTEIPPMTHAVPMDMALRLDEAQPPLPVEQALRGVPKAEDNLFVVPAIIPGSES